MLGIRINNRIERKIASCMDVYITQYSSDGAFDGEHETNKNAIPPQFGSILTSHELRNGKNISYQVQYSTVQDPT